MLHPFYNTMYHLRELYKLTHLILVQAYRLGCKISNCITKFIFDIDNAECVFDLLYLILFNKPQTKHL